MAREYTPRIAEPYVIHYPQIVAVADPAGARVEVVEFFDCVGGATLAAVLRTLRYGAAVAASGLTGGSALETTVYPFIVRNVALLGVDTVSTPLEERIAVWEALAGGFPLDVLDTMVEGEVGLDGLEAVLADILAGRVRGRMLVRPAD